MSWLVSLIPEAAQLITGIIQSSSKEPSRPKYTIPKEVYNYMNMLQQRARTGLPGKDTMQENLMSTAASQLTSLKEAAPSGAALMGGVSALQEKVIEGARGLDIMDAQFKDQAGLDLARGMMQMAEYRDREYDVNIREPYLLDLNEYYNKKEAGNQNIANAFTSLTSLAMMIGDNSDIDQGIQKITQQSESAGAGGTIGAPKYKGSGFSEEETIDYDILSSMDEIIQQWLNKK